MEAGLVSVNWWMHKEDVVYTHSGILLSHKEWNLAIFNNMDGAREYNANTSQLKTSIIWFHWCGISERKQMSKGEKETEREKNQETDS